MYRPRTTTPALVAALTTLVVLSSSLLGGNPAAASAGSESADQPADSVLVTGTGEVFGEPDMLTANLAVETNASTVDEALNRANTAAIRMRDALVRAGLTRADLQTSNVDVSPQRDDEGRITGYTVSEGLTATIRNLPQAGEFISEAIAAGGDAARLNGVWLAIEDDTALLTEARKKAFADARAKAEQYAREANRQLARVIKVSEATPGDAGSGGQDLRTGADSPVPIEPGRQRLAVTVTVEWALRPASVRHSLHREA
ncbi:SIMPL domain-containing protein [Virgisporangium aurantiacum]|uniref:Putative conserved lipoprotein LpqG n=1 Tax=Virgisporangium aurantiacum TaxID=175570 RepID=A0A8J3Z962_9ACTN|nr:SIMPL domain-containing protein [Virgisporangium aurantiacum]GIJ57230.1 putative conserved lipoprotein LpqG [Virgisporangium aurantiacum]